VKQTDDHHVAALDRLADQLRVVMRLGEMLLSAGASAFRVKDGMDRIAHAVGIATTPHPSPPTTPPPPPLRGGDVPDGTR